MSSIAMLNGLYPRETPEGGQQIRRLFSLIIATLALILLLELVFHLVVSPRLRLTKVEIAVDRALSLSDSEILQLAEIKGDEFFFSIDEALISQRIESFAPVKSATVEKVFPNTLRIGVEQRTALVICLAEVDGKTVPLAIDADGVVFQIGASVENLELPVLSGLTFNTVELGQRVNRGLLGFFRDLRELEETDSALFSLISEVKFVKKNRTTFEVLLFPRDYRVRVRIGQRISAGLVKDILLVLDVFAGQGIIEDLAEIDFRTDAPLVTFKEE